MTRGGHVVVVGSLNADLGVRTPRLPGPGETVTGSELTTSPGGKSSNQAAAAALLGADVRLVGAVGEDDHGARLLESARAAGVDTSGVRALPGVATGTAIIVVDDAGENTIVVSPGANGALAAEHLPQDAFAGAAVVCLALEVPLDAVEAAAAAGAAAGATVILNLSPVREVPAALLAATDILLVNEHELAAVAGATRDAGGWGAASSALAALGVDRAIVTLGAAGAVVLDRGDAVEVPAPRVDAVDTTGSGDAFTGAVAAGLAEGMSLADAAAFGAAAGAIAATGHGAQASYADRRALDAFRAAD